MMVWFPCYVNDLLGSLRWKCMTPAQRGAYWQLICWQMQAEDGHLPTDVKSLSVLADLDLVGENACIVEAFPIDETGKRANGRALREWVKRQVVSAKRSDAGSKRIANAQQLLSKCSANAATTTTTTTTDNAQPKKTLSRRAASASLDGFAEFWEAYPRKVGKGAAEKAWSKVPAEAHPVVMKAIQVQRFSPDWKKDGGQFIPNPATWLNQRRWEDDVGLTGQTQPQRPAYYAPVKIQHNEIAPDDVHSSLMDVIETLRNGAENHGEPRSDCKP